MKKIALLMLILIPALLFGVSQDKTRVIAVSSDTDTWLGVSVKNLTEKMLEDMNLEAGVKIEKVYKESPAEKAGLKKGDILISYDNKKIENVDELVEYVRDSNIDQEVQIQYQREGLNKSANVRIAERKIKSWVHKAPHRSFYWHDRNDAWLGVRTDDLNDQLRKYFGAPENMGVLIEEVMKDSPAEKAGLKAGDVIVQVGEKEINDTRDLVRAVNYFDPDDEVEIRYIRNKKQESKTVKLGKNEGRNLRMFGLHPDEDFDVFVAPDLEGIPEDIDIEIDPEDLEELESLEEVLRDKMEMHKMELDEKLDAMKDKVKRIKIRVGSKII